MTPPLEAALVLAAGQHGAVSTDQLRDVGLARSAIHRLRNGSSFEGHGPRVLIAAGSADSARRRAMVAVLDAGPNAVLSHTSAAALWDLPGYFVEPLHVIGDRGNQNRHSGFVATVHEPRLLESAHVTVLDGIPVTAPARTVFDLANLGLHPDRVERALDAAWARNLVNQRTMDEALGQLARRGRQGVALLRRLLKDRRDNYRPPESGLEHRFQEVLGRYGCPPMRRQIDVGDDGQWIGRIDFVAEGGVPVLVEVQSARYHSALSDQRADEARNAALRADGWEVVEVTGNSSDWLRQ